MELVVKNIKGSDTKKKVKLSDNIFGIEPNDHAIYLDVKQYLANQRQGTHKSKERGEVAGSTRKILKQKGSGNARVGSANSPIRKGGGTIFGPRPKDYGFKLNKKLKSLARKSALSYKAKEGCLFIVEDFSFDAPKTKEFNALLENLKVNEKKSLFVLSDINKNIYLSSRNLKNTKVVTISGLNTYDLMNASNVLLCEGSLESIQTKLS